MLLAGAVEEPPRQEPPAAPAEGTCYVVASDPSGSWASYADHVAAFTAAGWRLLPPVEGMEFHIRSNGLHLAYRAGQWEVGTLRASTIMIGEQQVVGTRAGAIADPAGGTQIDSQARAAISAILGALRGHGLIAS